MNGRFMHISADGKMTNVTEGVQALYDLVISSMNWGSGFWSYEDALPVAEIAQLAGFERCDEAERYVREALHRKDSGEWQRLQACLTQAYVNGKDVPHDHVYSSAGRCMCTYCRAEQ